MNIWLVFSTIIIPTIMIFIGVLYKHNSYKKINTILDLVIPIASTFTGVSDDKKEDYSNISNIVVTSNKKFSLIWLISGICLSLLSLFLLILNKGILYDTSITVLEIQCFVVVAVFISVEFILKRILKANKFKA